jgi:hypothetical protein
LPELFQKLCDGCIWVIVVATGLAVKHQSDLPAGLKRMDPINFGATKPDESNQMDSHIRLNLAETLFKGGQRGLRNIVRRVIFKLTSPGLPKREGKLRFVTERRRQWLGYTIGVRK